MIREAVVSSDLASVGYDDEAMVLELEFRNGGVYRYYAVPSAVHDGLMSAQSKGRYFNASIRHVYRCERIG